MPCNHVMWMMLTPAAAALWKWPEYQIPEAVSLSDWKDIMQELDADGVRSHLLSWHVESNREGFEDVVDILHEAGVDGQGLLFARKQPGLFVVPLRDLLIQKNVTEFVLLNFFGLLETYPDVKWFSNHRVNWIALPFDQRRYIFGIDQNTQWNVDIAIYVLVIVVALVALWYNVRLHPKTADKTKPGNQYRRIRNTFYMFLSSTSFVATYTASIYGKDARQFVTTFVICFEIGLAVLSLQCVVELSIMMSRDLLKHLSSREKLPAALKETWVNTSVLSTLMLTVVLPYGYPFDADKELHLFPGGLKDVESYGVEMTVVLHDSFLLAVCISVANYIIAVISATVHLLYTAALSEQDMLQYIADNPAAPAEAMMWFLAGLGWHSCATMYLVNRGNAAKGFWGVLGAVFYTLFCLRHYVRGASQWVPPGYKQGQTSRLDSILASTLQTNKVSHDDGEASG